MSNRTRKPLRRLILESLEDRAVPATFFKIDSLTGDNVGAINHTAVTGPDKGGIAVSGSQVLVTGFGTLGTGQTGRFNRNDLSGGTAVGAAYDSLIGDLNSQKVYVLGSNATTVLNGPGTVTHLLEVNGTTGALTGAAVALSASPTVTLGFGSGLFAGYDRVVLHDATGGHAFEVALPTGTVTDLGAVALPFHQMTSSWAFWGTAEFFGGQNYLDYVQDSSTVVRQRVSDGQVAPLANFFDLGSMASFTVSPANNRWYFHQGGFFSQFGFGPVLGFANATFVDPAFLVTNTNDAGPGSLRQAVLNANAAPGVQTITFDVGVTGAITLGAPILVLNQSVNIVGPGTGVVTVAGTGANTLFSVAGGLTLGLEGLTLSNPAGLTVPYALAATGDLVVTAGTGDVAFTNTLTVSGGTLTVTDGNGVELGTVTTVNSTLTAASGILIGSGDTLAGSGVVTGAVTVQSSGTLSPGGTGVGALTVNGNVAVQTGGTVRMDLNGAFPGAHDQLLVNGTLNLGTATNFNGVLGAGYSPTPQETLELFVNDATDPVVGLLNGVVQRGGLTIGGTLFQVRYDAGTGNDVRLEVNSSPALDTSVTTSFVPVLEDTVPASNPGTAVDELLSSGGLYSDPQGVPPSGLAVTGLVGAAGTWQFSLNGGGSWTPFGAVTANSATLLRADGGGQTRVRFQPNRDFFGSANLSFRGWDTMDGRANGATGVNASAGGGNAAFSAATETAFISVLAVNDAPVAGPDAHSMAEDGALTVPPPGVLGNDSDVDGPGTLTAALVNGPAHGTLTLNTNGSFSYTPAANYFGTDSFSYKVLDGEGAFDVGTVTLTINAVNDPPTARDDTAFPAEDAGTITIDVLGNDAFAPDVGETLTITATTDPSHGTVSIAPGNAAVRYTPAAHYNGPDAFTYTISDGNGATATATVNVTVTPVNDPPDAVNDSVTLNEDGNAQAIDVRANDTDAPDDGETLTITTVTQGRHGTVTITGGGTGLTYTPDADYAGPDTFLYTLSDGNGSSDVAAVTVAVRNDAADRLEVVTSPAIETFTENMGSVPLFPTDADLRVGTAHERTVTLATVRFANGFVKGKDKLEYITHTSPEGIAIRGKYDVKLGVLTLTGAARPEDYDAALQKVKYMNASPAPVDGVRTLAVRLQDVGGVGDPAFKLVKVVGVPNKPTVAVPGPALTYRARGRPLAVAATLTIKDLDSTRLERATVRIGTGFDPNRDALQVVTKPGIRPVYDGTTGVLTLTGNATIATYLAVLKSLKFITTVGAVQGPRTLEFRVFDGQLESDMFTRTVTVV